MKLRSIIAIATLSAGLFSCSKDFLDREPPASRDSDGAITNVTTMQQAVNGMYAKLRDPDLYGRTLPVWGDLRADNIFVHPINSGRYTEYNDYTFNQTNTYATDTWADLYNTILRANNIINADVAASDGINQLRGEAYAVRALMYFELLRNYATRYTDNPSGDGVPLILTYDPFLKPARSTKDIVYNQVIDDLEMAASLMEDDNEDNSYMSAWAAKGLLARVHLYMGNYGDAKTIAADVVANSGYTLAPAAQLAGYWEEPAPSGGKLETLFEVSIDGIDNTGSNGIDNMFEQAGYGDLVPTNGITGITAMYEVDDARYNAWIKLARRNNASNNPLIPVVIKYPNRGNTADKDNIKVIRLAEVMLILAESAARTSDPTTANTVLTALRKTRQPSFGTYNLAGDALIQEVLNEKRRELAFEGHRYYDLQRLGLAIANRGIPDAEYPANVVNIPNTSFRRILPIPQTERDNNNNIAPNPGYN